MSKDIVPWKCHVCSSEFDTPRGGVCARCNQATCRKHLHQVGQKSKLDMKWVCDTCLTNAEKNVAISIWTAKCRRLLRDHILLVISLGLILLPWIMQALTFLKMIQEPNDGWITYAPFYWGSMLCLIAGIIYHKITARRAYRFIDVIGLFAVQSFFGFHPLTPYPVILIITFTVAYKFIIERAASDEVK